ncbi:hypothetical protein BZG13_05535 [Salinivibrio sp. ML323]|uniref:hypothetical protein n=1 Tax=Salinivibrio sp. ML323 TaxID=1909474 RepID=UPI00098674B4|nr:hypothetical protein [Salinivibrio sp. ML323]OOE58927.1 hypothetical protein BZG13_05535 [Salinivibrio sp. ML323]
MEYKEISVAIIAVFGVFFTARVALKNNNKNLLIKTVTDERAVWRKELRDTCAEFVKLIYEQMNNSSVSNKPRINELKVHLKLRVNPSSDNKHHLDKAIISLSQELVDMLEKEAIKNDIQVKLVELEGKVQELLKQEWDKSKGEALTGELAK